MSGYFSPSRDNRAVTTVVNYHGLAWITHVNAIRMATEWLKQ